jgi:hypothetical protein
LNPKEHTGPLGLRRPTSHFYLWPVIFFSIDPAFGGLAWRPRCPPIRSPLRLSRARSRHGERAVALVGTKAGTKRPLTYYQRD